MNPRPCPVCSEPRAEGWLRKENFAIVRCLQCGMKYIPDATVLAPDYYSTDADSFYISDDKLRGDYAPHRYDRELQALRRNCASGKVLDVGCSTGGFLHQAGLRFPGSYDLYGTDVAQSATAIAANHGVKVISANFLADDFPEREFQAITFWAVLEHLLAPAEYLRQAHRLLAPGGRAFVVVPNVQSLAVRLLGHRYRYVMAEHVNYFSRETLQRLFEPQFVPVEITTSHFNPLVIGQDLFRRTSPKPAERAQLLNRTNAMKERAAFKPLYACYKLTEKFLAPAGLADNILAVFQKK